MFRSALAFTAAFAWSAAAGASCGSTFCAINTAWDTQGAWVQPGWRLDVRYEHVNQNQPRHGNNKIAVGAIPEEHDEVRTNNRNWLTSLDYTFNADWGMNVLLPVVKRTHKHLENDFDTGEQMPEKWDFRKLGDARVAGRYRIATVEGADHTLGTLGLNFGLKLPTGSTNVKNSDGERAERSLQPGSGTTDAFVGLYYSQLLPMKSLSWFTQAVVQRPLNTDEGYRPGARLALDGGLRYDLTDRFSLMLQLNGLVKARDSGSNAEPDNSGGKSLFVGPGASFALTQDVRLYGFAQVPIYQYVNGVQLGVKTGVVLGLSARF
jgi:hypothetical protein